MAGTQQPFTAQQRETLLQQLKARFESNRQRHEGIPWADVHKKLAASPQKLHTLWQMEQTGGEPDVVVCTDEAGSYAFFDCAPESPAGRRNLCYDAAALASRKANKPQGSAVGLAAAMGAAIITEEEYRALQACGEFDTKTSSWVATPAAIRKLGGALFCDRRYGHVFTYHNGAESYYAARGFRAVLQL